MQPCELQPYFNPVSAVVYSLKGRDVDICCRRMMVENGKPLTMNERSIVDEAKVRSQEVVKRGGIE